MKTFYIVIIFFFPLTIYSQLPITVWEGTLKVPGLGQENIYFSLAEGDELQIRFKEINGKELKEFQLIEWPGNTKYMEYKTSKVDNKNISISRTGVFQLHLGNNSLGGRVCQVQLSRIPASDALRNFNTSVEWKTISDSSLTTTMEKYLISNDTSVVNREFVTRVNSTSNANGAMQAPDFDLPENTVAWSYYIGVDQQGQQAFQTATEQCKQTLTPLALRIPGYGPLAALALQGITFFARLNKGEDISYSIVDGPNRDLAYQNQPYRAFRQNKVINDFSTMKAPLTGKYFFFMRNDNMITGVNVSIHVAAIVVREQWGERPVQKLNVSTRQVPVHKE